MQVTFLYFKKRLRSLIEHISYPKFVTGLLIEILFSIIFALIYTLACDEESDLTGKRYHGFTWNNFFENFYFSTVTIFGVGFGDIYATSAKARLITLINIYLSITFLFIFF